MVHHEVYVGLLQKPNYRLTCASLTTPGNPKGAGVWTFYGSTIIDAPASVVWSTVLDFQSYHKWNLYTPRVSTSSGTNNVSPDDIITLAYRPEPTGETMDIPCQILHVDHQKMSLCWRGRALSIPTFVFCPEKINLVTPISKNQCRYEVYETQSGPMAYVVRWSIGAKLSAMSQGMAEELKKYVEDKSGS